MAYEDIEIRITKSGEIFVKIEGSTEERLRDYHAFLEETVGPVKSANAIDRPDWERSAEIVSETEENAKRGQTLER